MVGGAGQPGLALELSEGKEVTTGGRRSGGAGRGRVHLRQCSMLRRSQSQREVAGETEHGVPLVPAVGDIISPREVVTWWGQAMETESIDQRSPVWSSHGIGSLVNI
jgi:hypothetical protein